MINRDKLEHILEYARQQRHIGQSCKVPPEDMVEIMERLLNAGNSPVIPDGYVMVPKEPTAEMIYSGIAAHYDRSQIQIHDRPAHGPMECAYVAMLAAAPQSPGSDSATMPGKWIPVSERMPEIGDIVLTAMGGVVNVGEMECSAANCRFFTSVISGRELPATHWMPLPAAPQEVKGE
ncbi:Eaa1 [Klebsiella pneumoniae]|nr:Eaa1 [Klebsiella pneumoniae]